MRMAGLDAGQMPSTTGSLSSVPAATPSHLRQAPVTRMSSVLFAFGLLTSVRRTLVLIQG